MSRARTIVAILAAGFLLGASATDAGEPAAKQSRPARDCFAARTVNGFRPVGREAVDVTVSRNRQYRLTLAGYCPDVDSSLRIALRSRAGSSFICAGLDADILVRGPTGLQRCAVTEVRRLSLGEIDAARRSRR